MTAVDPRIRERRVAVRREQGRRRLRVLLVVISLLSAVGVAWLVVRSPMLAVSSVEVRGLSRASAQELRRAAGVDAGEALLLVDTGAVARRVEESPWVSTARATRDWPDVLRITVVERVPAGWARRPLPEGAPPGTQGAVALVDASGRVLAETPAVPVGLPELAGLAAVPAPGGEIRPVVLANVLRALPAPLRTQVSGVERSGDEVVLRLAASAGGPEPAAGEVRLGPPEDVPAKGAAALAVLDQLAARGERVGYVDVHVPGAPASR